MGTFRITYRMEIYIDADSFEDAQSVFYNLSAEEMVDAEFVEQVSIEDENGNEQD